MIYCGILTAENNNNLFISSATGFQYSNSWAYKDHHEADDICRYGCIVYKNVFKIIKYNFSA